MGKPIAGRGQRPFNIGGILVNGAKDGEETFIKDIYIYKQRSYNVYDLIDELGQVHEYMTLVYRNADGKLLNYTDLDFDLTNSLADKTFYIKEQDPKRGIFGFSTLYQYNKIKVQTGDYIFRDSEEFDYSLLAVQVIPYSVVLNVGDDRSFDIRSIPLDYDNLQGTWEIDNNCVEPITPNNRSSQFTVKAVSEGDAIISFTPDANSTLTSFAHVRVLSKPIEIQNLNIVYPSGETDKAYSLGETFTVRLLTDPLNALSDLPYPDTIEYDTEYFELTNVSDDNKYFTFKVISDKDAEPYNKYGGIRKSLVFSHTINGVKYKTYTYSTIGYIYVVTKSNDVKFIITSNKQYARYYETIKMYASYDTNLYKLDPNDPIVWEVEATHGNTGDGYVTPINDFECDYTAAPPYNSWRNVGVRFRGKFYSMTVWFDQNDYAKSVRIAPLDVNTLKPGESVQLSVLYDPPDYVPSEPPVFNYGVWGDIYKDFFDITPDGLVTVKQEIPRNIEVRANMFLPNVIYRTNEFRKNMALTIDDVKPLYMNVRQYQGIYISPLGKDIVVSVSQSPTVNSYIKIEYEWDDPSFVEEDKISNEYQLSNYYSRLNTGAQLTFKPLKIGTHTISFWFKDFPETKYSSTFTVFSSD